MAATTKESPHQSIRIPLVGSFNTRSFWTPAVGSYVSSGYVGLGIVGLMIVGKTLGATADQRFVNVIPDRVVNPLTDKETFYCYKRPGFETHTTPEAGSVGTAIKLWTGQGNGSAVISAFGNTNSTIYNEAVSIGTTTGVVKDITETVVGTTPNLVFNCENGKAYYYPEGGALTEILDVDFPTNASLMTTGAFVHMDGYSFIMTTTGRIYNSDLGSISAWTSTSFLSATAYPDLGVGLARYKDLIVAFGTETTEMFRNVGNALGSPLQRVDEAFMRIGCIGPRAITQLEDNIAWVASSDVGSISVYMLDGYRPVRISTDAIDVQLQARGNSTVYMSSAKMNGKTFLFIQFGTVTFVYCIEDKMWHEWNSENAVLWHRWAANTAVSNTLYSISRNSTSGKVYKTNVVLPVYQDDGTSYIATIQTSKVDLNNESRKFLHRLTLVGDTSPSTNNVSVSWTDDDYTTFSTARTVDLNASRKYLSNCGAFRRRAFKISNTSSQPFRLEGIEIEYSQGVR